MTPAQRLRVIVAMTLAAEAGKPCPVQVCPLAGVAHDRCVFSQ
jgi:hypothetical protein